jgi:hypothetical protein
MYPKLQKVWKELMRDTVKGTWKVSTTVRFETILRIEGEHLKLIWPQYRVQLVDKAVSQELDEQNRADIQEEHKMGTKWVKLLFGNPPLYRW